MRPRPDDEPEVAVFALLRLALSAKLAADLGLPRLASECARECRRIAERVLVELSPAVAALPAEAELALTGDLHVGDLGAMLLRAYGEADESDEVEP